MIHENTHKTEMVIDAPRLRADESLTAIIDELIRSNSPFLSNLITPDQLELPESIKEKMVAITSELGFADHVVSDVDHLLTMLYINQIQHPIYIGRSADNEFLAYIYDNGTYKNLLIDEDGDVEVLVIPPDRSKTLNYRFYKEDAFTFSQVVTKFNDLPRK